MNEVSEIYRSEAGKKEIERRYREMVDSLGEFDERWVETRYGETHVLVTGPKDGTPLLVFHGGNMVNPVSLEWFLPLADEFRLYAPDTIGHPGLSAETRVSPRDSSYGEWVTDLLDGLGLDSVAMVGPSYGGGIVLRTAAYAPERIDRAALINPAGLGTGSIVRMLREIVLPMYRYRLRPTEERLGRAVAPMFSDPVEEGDREIVDLVGTVFHEVRLERTFPKRATREELSRFGSPTLLVVAEEDVFFPPEQIRPHAERVIPYLVGTVVLEGESHFPSERGRERIVSELRTFLR
ncbi:alpha/beta fold hydrolase [Natronorarus salvus]|uniref:alpha/beta fold hydrolase n=1 Tax=Natronorarus salvus TaxID=3117733 RepID=UPI002F26105F